MIARNAEVPIANTRLNPVTEDAVGSGRRRSEAGQFGAANPDAARDALGGQPLTVRIGYQTPNARLAATVGAIAKSCAPAGITVQDVASETTGPLTLRDNEIDVLLASTGGATGSGSTGSSAMDAYDLHTGNGNNLSGYTNPRIDGIIDALAVTADPKELARLLGEAGPILWADMPTLPLYRQQRTLITSKKMYAVSSNPTRWGAGWNMDRWVLEAVSARNATSIAVIASLTREVADFPEPGIQFKDLTPVLADRARPGRRHRRAGRDRRGCRPGRRHRRAGASCSGGAVAIKLGIGVLAVRKGGKLPPPVHSETYDLEYGTATLEIPADGIDLTGRNDRDHRRRAGHRRHPRGRDTAAQHGGRERHRRRGGARTGRARRARPARTTARQQLAHHLRRYPRSLSAAGGDDG